MTAITTATMIAAGVAAGALDEIVPGDFMLEYLLDGSKKTIAAADTVDFFDIPAYAGAMISGASVEVITPGTATGTLDIQLGGADVTGLTAWATDAAAGTKLVKLATAANTVVNGGSASAIRLQQNTAGLGTGVLKIRVWGVLYQA